MKLVKRFNLVSSLSLGYLVLSETDNMAEENPSGMSLCFRNPYLFIFLAKLSIKPISVTKIFYVPFLL